MDENNVAEALTPVNNRRKTMSNNLLAFHGNAELKEKILMQLKAHKAADQLIHGTYWSEGRGCAIGCSSVMVF